MAKYLEGGARAAEMNAKDKDRKARQGKQKDGTWAKKTVKPAEFEFGPGISQRSAFNRHIMGD